MIVLIGASASGKTEIANIIIEKYHFEKMITYTTRNMRIGEINGKDYYFITKEEFIKKLNNNEFLETTIYHNNYYGTAFKDAEENKVLIVDVNGANKIYQYLKDKVTIFLLEAPLEVRIKRMELRGDSPEQIKSRIENDQKHFIRKNINHIDFIIETGYKSLNELADLIYQKYKNFKA
ncbi:MAG TPA: AAA family ATPase [Bacilli bacterium]